MPEDRPKGTETEDGKRRFGRRKLIAAAVVVVTIICVLAWKGGWLDFRSVDEQLAAIDAELAIADSENAAVRYRRFLTDPVNAAILDDLSSLSPSARADAWASSEHPELAAELRKNQAFMNTLLGISQMPKARFPVYPDQSDSWQALRDMRKLAFALSWAAGNDLAEGRAEAAYGKYRCQMRLACQLGQQPAMFYRLVGVAIEGVALHNIRSAVMRDGTTPEQLRSLETILKIPMDQGEEHAELTAKIDRLVHEKERSEMSTVQRLKYLWVGRKAQREQQRRQPLIYLRRDATRRAIPILIAMRRHKDETGIWPETLEQIEPKLPAEALVDPQNGGPFVYKREGDSFVFYSRGPNGIDEHGSYKRPADDYPSWTLRITKVPAANAEKQRE